VRRRGPTRIVDAAHDLAPDARRWLSGIAAAALPQIAASDGVGGFFCSRRADGLWARLQSVSYGVSPTNASSFSALEAAIAPVALNLLGRGRDFSGTGAVFADDGVEGEDRAVAVELITAAETWGFGDLFVMGASGSAETGCVLWAPLRRVRRLTPAARRRWKQIAAHVADGLRLRAAVAALGPAAPMPARTTWMVPERSDLAADRPHAASLLQLLRRHAVRAERAGADELTCQPEDVAAAWQALLEGRWSLLDVFAADGRRYLVARENPPTLIDQRHLHPRELLVVRWVSQGHSNTLIAAELGLSLNAVARLLTRARLKLRVATRGDLIQLARGLEDSTHAARAVGRVDA
jgi:DNA-binding CsgD family transcriptional regulator